MKTIAWILCGLAVPAVAAADEPAHPPVTVELAAGAPSPVEYVPGPPAVLVVGAAPSAARLELPTTAPAADAALSAETITGPHGARLGRVRLAASDGRTFETLVALGGSPAVPQLVWSGWTGLNGDLGERVGWRIDVGDVDGDGASDVLVGRIAETTRVCGQTDLPLLHRRAYDWSSQTLRPVTAPRPGLDAAGATALPAAGANAPAFDCSGGHGCTERATPASAVDAPGALLPLLEYRAASSSYGDDGEPVLGAPPAGLGDMDGRSGWAEGVGGAGRLEFVTARIVTGAVPAQWLAVRATDDQDATAPKTRGRPRSLLVIDGAGHRWKLDVADDAAARAGGVSWYELPEPPGGGCLTVALLDAWPATAAEGRRADVTWISDVQAFAVVRPLTDAEPLRAVLDDDASPVAAERLLHALGGRALDVMAELAPQLGPTGAARAADFLLGSTDEHAVLALSRLLGSDNAAVARATREALVRRGEDATPALVPLLHDPTPAVQQAALELIGEIGGPAALPDLLARTVAATDEERPTLRRTLGGLLQRHANYADEVVAVAEQAAEEGRDAVVADLLRVTPLETPDVRAAAGALVARELDATTPFASRYFLVQCGADLLAAGETSPAAALLRAATGAAEPELRAEAARALAAAPPTLDLAPLLDDPWPAVRAAAADAIGRRGVDAELRTLAAHFAAEPWPLVRAAAAAAFLRGTTWPGDDVARRLLADPSPDVRGRALAALDDRGDDPALAMLADVVERHTERLELRQAALAALARRCWPELKPLVIRVVEWSVQGEARRGDQALALDAIRALGTAGFANVRALLEEIVREAPVAPLRAAALEALGDLGDPEAQAAIEAWVHDAEPSVAGAAGAALEALRRGRATRRCEGNP